MSYNEREKNKPLCVINKTYPTTTGQKRRRFLPILLLKADISIALPAALLTARVSLNPEAII